MHLLLNKEHFTFNLQYKHSGTFANGKYELSILPQKSENVRPHRSNYIPHDSQSSRENATSSSGTSHQPLIRKDPRNFKL